MVADLERESLYQKPRRRWIINTETYLNGRTEGGCGPDYFCVFLKEMYYSMPCYMSIDITTQVNDQIKRIFLP